jgi:hypothetical protein
MPRWWALLLVFGVALAQNALELEAFRLTNEARRAHGLRELAWDDVAYAAARKHALDMLERGFFDHVNPDGLGPADRLWAEGVLEVVVGENLALYEGYPAGHVAGVVVGDWLNSPPHRKNLLAPAFTHLGLALVQRGDRIAVVQNFIARPFELWVWRTPSRRRMGWLRYRGGASATVGLFVGDAFRAALQPPSWRGELEVEPGSTVRLGLWHEDRYLLACAFVLPETACGNPKLSWSARYEERTVPSVRVQLALPPGAYWLGYGREPQPLRTVSGAVVVDAPLDWTYLWVGLSQGTSIEYTHRIPLQAGGTERVQKGAQR